MGAQGFSGGKGHGGNVSCSRDGTVWRRCAGYKRPGSSQRADASVRRGRFENDGATDAFLGVFMSLRSRSFRHPGPVYAPRDPGGRASSHGEGRPSGARDGKQLSRGWGAAVLMHIAGLAAATHR